MRTLLALTACIAVSGCVQGFGGPALISGRSPPSAMAASAEPEPVNSLPPGAEGIGASGPNARFPNAGSVTLALPR